MYGIFKRVLLIDDDADDAMTFSDALRAISDEIVFNHLPDGITALSILQERESEPPDIIFLDVNMPIINGWDCLRDLKKLASLGHIPIIMYSTFPIHNKGLAPEDVGAAAFLSKAGSFRELQNKLAEALNTLY